MQFLRFGLTTWSLSFVNVLSLAEPHLRFATARLGRQPPLLVTAQLAASYTYGHALDVFDLASDGQAADCVGNRKPKFSALR